MHVWVFYAWTYLFLFQDEMSNLPPAYDSIHHDMVLNLFFIIFLYATTTQSRRISFIRKITALDVLRKLKLHLYFSVSEIPLNSMSLSLQSNGHERTQNHMHFLKSLSKFFSTYSNNNHNFYQLSASARPNTDAASRTNTTAAFPSSPERFPGVTRAAIGTIRPDPAFSAT